jgi:hypothetical protein
VKKHRLEEMVDILVARTNARIDAYVDYLSVEGRPVFTQPLSDEQLAAMWDNPQMKLQLQQDADARGGDQALQELQNEALRAKLKQPTLGQKIDQYRVGQWQKKP